MVPPPSNLILGTTRTLWHVIGPLRVVVGAKGGYGVTFFLRFVGVTGGKDA